MTVDIDFLTERLSLQDWRSARGEMYKALTELRELRAEVKALRERIAAMIEVPF